MAVRIDCPHCGAPCNVADEHLRRPIQCYKCKQVFTARGPTAAAPGPLRLEIGCASSRGRVRVRNEDSFLAQHLSWMSADVACDAALLVVADGMGGHQAGDRASRLVIQAVGGQLLPLLAGALTGAPGDRSGAGLAGAVDRAIREANRTVHALATGDAACKGMGATAVVVVVRGGEALIGHVGDCRVYRKRNGVLAQVTRDQTLVARMVELGRLTPERAKAHPARHEVSQAIGRRADIEPAAHRLDLARGDVLLACCDGLTAHVDGPDLQKALAAPAPSARQLARRLVDLADQRGGTDNCTVVVACCC